MKRFKILKNQDLLVNDYGKETIYTPYKVCDIPKEFGCITYKHKGRIKLGIDNWFKYKGLTYVQNTK
jgi:hypothetical protein